MSSPSKHPRGVSLLQTRGVPLFQNRVSLLLSRLAALVLLALLPACGDDDPFRGSATTSNTVAHFSLAAFSTGAIAPTAIDLLNQRPVRPELQAAGTNFQLAIDVNAQGQVSLLPVLTVLNPPTGALSVGLQRSPLAFDAVGRAPTGGYVTDSVRTAAPGETWLLQLQTPNCVFGDPFYGKLEIEGINLATRRAVVRLMINRNCGYRDLIEGLPRN